MSTPQEPRDPNEQQPSSGEWPAAPGGNAPSDPYAQQPAQAPPSGQQPDPGQQYPPPAYGQQQYAQPGYGQPQPAYGQPQPYTQPGAPQRPPGTEKNWMGTTSLVLSLLGLVIGITAIAGIVFGHLGLSANKRGEADNRGVALAGTIIGYVLTVLGILAVVGAIVLFGWVASECGGDNPAQWCTDWEWTYESA